MRMDSLLNTQQSSTSSRAWGQSDYNLNHKSIASLAEIDFYNQNTNKNNNRFQEPNYNSQVSRFNPYSMGSVTTAHYMYNPYNSGLYSHPGAVMPGYAAYDGKCFFLKYCLLFTKDFKFLFLNAVVY